MCLGEEDPKESSPSDSGGAEDGLPRTLAVTWYHRHRNPLSNVYPGRMPTPEEHSAKAMQHRSESVFFGDDAATGDRSEGCNACMGEQDEDDSAKEGGGGLFHLLYAEEE